jgi:hypothetical protein
VVTTTSSSSKIFAGLLVARHPLCRTDHRLRRSFSAIAISAGEVNSRNARLPLQRRLAVYSGPLELGGELDVFGPSDTNVEIIRGRAELTESKLLTLAPAGMDTILRHIDEVVSYVKSYDRMIHAIV